MRKLLVLFLVAALVPFMAGCRVAGLWGYDDNESTLVAQGNIVQLGLVLPGNNGVLANITGSSINDVQAWVKTTESYTWATMTKSISNTGSVLLAYTGDGSKLVVDNIGFVFKIGNGLVTRTFSIPTQSATLTTTGTPETITRVFEVTFTAGDAGITVRYYATATFSGTGSTLTFTFSGTPVDITGTLIAPTGQEIVSTTVAPDGVTFKALSTSLDSPTPVLHTSLDGAKFKVLFKSDVAVPTTFSIFVDNVVSTGASGKTLSNSDNSLSVAQGASSKELIVTLANTNYTLLATGKYKITITSAKASGVELLTTYPTFYIVVGTVLEGWTGHDSLPNSNQLHAASTDGIQLDFSNNLASPQTITGSVKLARYSLDGLTLEASSIIDMPGSGSVINNASLQIPFGTKRLVAGKKYIVTYLSGKILDTNGFPVEFTSPITFYTN